MPQRTAVWVCTPGQDIPAGWDLEYGLLLKKIDTCNSALSRTVVAAHAYVAEPKRLNVRFDRFVRYLQALGFVVHVASKASIPLKVTHALLLAAMSGRIDGGVLVWAHGSPGSRDSAVDSAFGEGLTYARAHGLDTVVWGTDLTPEPLKSGPFRDLRELGVMQAKGSR
jgi:hypothetical protein